MDAKEKCLLINDMTPKGGLFTGEKKEIHPKCNAAWRISPEPFWISRETLTYLEELGRHLLSFYEACNKLYSQSTRGVQPRWVAEYLDLGKPEFVIDYGRMRRFRRHLPLVIRPDIILTEGGMIISELDPVPGGIGFTGSLAQRYAMLGYDLVGSDDGMVKGFARMIRSISKEEDLNLTIVVSDESSDYRDEMEWLGQELDRIGLPAQVAHPREVIFTEDGLLSDFDGKNAPIDVLYRFFELFDLKNIPKSELMMYSAKKEKVVITPPFKAYLEEKMLFAFLHHPALPEFWKEELGGETFNFLREFFPKTWILDSRELPPYGVIPELTLNGRPVIRWDELSSITKRERDFVIKPSGFSELAWGSRGVYVGNDLSQEDWALALERALSSFDTTPYVLQEFHKGARFPVEYYDFDSESIKRMRGRVRLCPYYFVINGEAELSGILATICPPDKKLLHGMVDAVMVPCGVR